VDPYLLARRAAAALAELTGRTSHEALVVLGSGWAPAADAFGEPRARVPMTEVPGFQAPVAEGHLGEIRSCDVDGVATLVFLGRTHLYEGHGPTSVVHPIRTAAAAGVRLAVLTNANGALRDDWALGQPVLVSDHLNLTSVSPLAGARFVDLTDCWSRRLRDLARRLDPSLSEGVYALLRGPHYETAEEAEWLCRIGADMLGMSTVLEAIAAREQGIDLLGVSTVTALELSGLAIDPSEVVAVAGRTAERMGPLLTRVVAAGAAKG
jgi:purine-nucleoside phosphorylase